MCQFRWVIGFAAVGGLVQSILWMALGLVAALVYLCVIPISPYVNRNDFFRVSLHKLYFEGPKCKPDGSYLGGFENKYAGAITYLTHDRLFALMTIYVVINAVYFLLSIMMFNGRKGRVTQGLAVSWSVITLLLCLIDAFCVFAFINDFFSLSEAIRDFKGLDEIQNIPVVMIVISSRFFVCWLWNFLIGCFIFFDALCCRNIIRKPTKVQEEKIEKVQTQEKVKEVEEPREQDFVQPPVSVINGNVRSYFDILTHPDYLDYKKSMEAITRFSTSDRAMSVKEGSNRNWVYAPTEVSWHPKSHTSKEWEMTNEGYVSDEAERNVDFDHNLKNFESGQRKIKIVRPPEGKPVESVGSEPGEKKRSPRM